MLTTQVTSRLGDTFCTFADCGEAQFYTLSLHTTNNNYADMEHVCCCLQFRLDEWLGTTGSSLVYRMEALIK